jgi:hypothetical protein
MLDTDTIGLCQIMQETLFNETVGQGEGCISWVDIKEKVTAYGQNLILFCPVDNCCSEVAGWSVRSKMIMIDVKRFSNDPYVKYPSNI